MGTWLDRVSGLRVKLLLGFALTITLAIGTVTFVATRTTTKEFDRYITQDQALRYQRLASLLSSYYEQTGSWQGAQKLIEKAEEAYSGRIVLANPEGEVIGNSEKELGGGGLGEGGSIKIATLRGEEGSVGSLYLRKRKRSVLEKSFLASVNRSILLAAVISGAVGILFIVFYSRAIIGPVKAVTKAAQNMMEGRLDQRVEVHTRDEIGKLAETFNSMAEEIKKQEELRRNMVNDIAHELRNPLSKSHGYLEALQEGVMEPDEEIIDSLYRNSLLLNRLIEDLHDLALAEADRLQLNRELVVLQDVISSSTESVKVRAEESEVDLEVELGEDALVEVDPDRIGQVLRNLLDNAIAHTPEGGEVSLNLDRGEEKVEVAISDTGEGISEEDLPYIFNRFYRVDQSRARSSGGSGLGLTIAKEIVEAHDGEIWVDSAKGEGTTFTFSLPLAEV